VKTNQVARFAAVVLALAGVAALVASGVVALRGFQAQGRLVNPRRYDCGSVLFAKDPRTLAPRNAQVPPQLIAANTHCEKLRDSRTNKALLFMLAGAVPLLLVLALPAISRRSRRARRRARL
jgi:hypothetical protein